MLKEIHMASLSKIDECWYDLGATVYVCNNKSLFKEYIIVNGRKVLMGRTDSAKVT